MLRPGWCGFLLQTLSAVLRGMRITSLIWSDAVNLRTPVGLFLFFEDRASGSQGSMGDD